MKYTKSKLCQLGWLSCFGCCGHGFRSKEEIAKAITKNTLEFHKYRKDDRHIVEFLNRYQHPRECGICRNLVFDHEKQDIVCPGHPELNDGEDHRVHHHYCDVLHVCKTAFLFDLWGEDRQKAFLNFLRKKKQGGELDWYSYSICMADDSLLHEFEGLKWD